ncbi:unnamed protein product [Pylaiella littoralis]
MRCYSPSGPGARYTLNDLCTGRTYTVLLMRERADLLQLIPDPSISLRRLDLQRASSAGSGVGRDVGKRLARKLAAAGRFLGSNFSHALVGCGEGSISAAA